MCRRLIRFHVLLLLILSNTEVWGFQQLRPGRLPKDLRARLIPGLHAVFRTVRETGEPLSDSRVDRLPAVYIPTDTPPTAFLPSGCFTAQWSGYIKLRLKGRYRFFVAGRGQIWMEVNGNRLWAGDGAALDDLPPQTADLVRGYNAVTIRYESPPSGLAQLRVDWSGGDFEREPLPPAALLCDGSDTELVAAREHRRGRFLVARFQCFDCHRGLDRRAAGMMPELNRRAPDLLATAARLNSPWVAHWIRDPTRLRNRTSMPRVLHTLPAAMAAQQAADLATFLDTASSRRVPLPAVDATSVQRGEALFEDRGCIGCHRFSPPAQEDEWDRISLHFVAAKFRSGGLSDFLVDPQKHDRWSAMPRIGLTPDEAFALEAFLRQRSTGRLPPMSAGQAARGERLFSSLGCNHCHSQGEYEQRPPPQSVALFDGQRAADGGGCLAAQSHLPGVPEFALPASDRQAIQAALKLGLRAWRHAVPAEFASRQMRRLRCTTCHSHDTEHAQLGYILDEEGVGGHPPETVPSLTWAGDKLRTVWTRRLLTGDLGYRARVHLRIRMPVFPSRAQWLARGLAAQHGHGDDLPLRIVVDSAKVAVGEQLAAMDTGMSCHRCHPIADRQPQAPFDARSTNLVHVAARLRRPYYRRWMLNPQRIDPATKMLRFAPDGERTSLRQFYDGDASRQFEALWHYLQSLHQPRAAAPTTP